MNFEATYILEDERAMLRPIALADYDLLKEFAVKEPDLWTYSLVPAGSESLMQAYLQTALRERQEEKTYAFLVFDKKYQQYAGSTRFYDIQVVQKALQLGYTWYGKAFQGTGLNKHCKYLLLQFAFETLEMERVEFRADNDNKRSIAAMKSIGCTVEGILRSNTFKSDGSRRDSIILSILKSEWRSHVNALLQQKLTL